MANSLSDDMTCEFLDTFKMLDEHEYGQISGQQYLLALKAHGIEPDAKMNERALSQNPINLQEFMNLMMYGASTESWCRAEMIEAFEVFDKDNTGLINQQQTKRVLHRLGEKLSDVEIDQQFFQFDVNDDMLLEHQGFFRVVLSSDQSQTARK
jgi:Ca2+-binding EF-hand superfamily protein